MGRPTPEELQARRRQMAAVNNMGRSGGGGANRGLPATNTTISPPMAGQPESVTGNNPALAQQTTAPNSALPQQGAAPGSALPAPTPGNSGVAAPQTPVGVETQESQEGAGDSMNRVDPSTFTADRQNSSTYLMEELPDRVGPADTIAAAETAHMRVLDKVKDPESAAQVAAVTEEMGFDGPGVENMRNMFGEKFKGVTQAKVDSGEMTANQKKKQDKKFTNLFGGLTKQEFGLFLFEYGAIMMANGDKGFGGAAGAAGIGALASLQSRQQYASKMEIEAAESTRKADLEERRLGISEDTLLLNQDKAAREKAAARGLEYLNTDEGMFPAIKDEHGAVTGYDMDNPLQTKNEKTGEMENVRPWSASSGEYSWQAQDRQLEETFDWMSQADRVLMRQTGMTPLDIRSKADSMWMQLEGRYQNMTTSEKVQNPITVEGKRYTWPVPERVRLEWIRQQIRSYGYSAETAKRLGGKDPNEQGALGGYAGPPEHKSDSDWKKQLDAEGDRPLTQTEFDEIKQNWLSENQGALGGK